MGRVLSDAVRTEAGPSGEKNQEFESAKSLRSAESFS